MDSPNALLHHGVGADDVLADPWRHPHRMLRLWRRHFRTWAILLGLLLGAIGFLVAMRYASSSYRLTGTLQVLPPTTPVSVGTDQEPYRPPALAPEEMHSLFVQWSVFERLRPMSDREETVLELRERIGVDYDRRAHLFTVTLDGAADPVKAEKMLHAYCQMVVVAAREQVLERIRQDEEYFRRNVREAEQELQAIERELADYRTRQGFIDVTQEIATRQERVDRVEARLHEARQRLADARHRVAELPALIDQLPDEIAAPPAELPAIDQRLVALREEVRRLAAIYTDRHPRLIAARQELAAFEREYDEERRMLQRERLIPNPLVQTLRKDLMMLELSLPQLEQEVRTWEGELEEARAALDELPAVSTRFMQLEQSRAKHERMLDRFKARLAEIEIARSLSTGQLQVLDPPNAAYAEERYKSLKVAVVTAGAVALGVALAAGVALLAAWGDGRLRSPFDCRLLLGAERVAVVPRRRARKEAYRAWLQELSEHLTRRHRRILFLPGADPGYAAGLAAAVGRQLARSRLSTLLVGDPRMMGEGDTPLGLSQVVEGKVGARECTLELGEHLSLLPLGDLAVLLDVVPSGRVEEELARIAEGYECLLLAPPVAEDALLFRLSRAADAVVIVLDPDDNDGRRIAEDVDAMGHPVALAVLTR